MHSVKPPIIFDADSPEGEHDWEVETMRFLALLYAVLAAAPAFGQQPTPVTIPLFQPAQEFGPTVADIRPDDTRLTDQEESSLRAAISAMEAFPAYVFSGCHDRAHAAHMLLPAALRPKVMKIWLASPAKYTAVLPGLIGLKGPGAASQVSWGHHVALAFRNAAGEVRVVDPVLKPREVLTERQWFDLMILPRMTLWTLTKGDVYLIEASKLSPSTTYASSIWNGRLEPYQRSWIPANIARDAVGVDAVAGTTCPELVQMKANPGGVLALLERGQAAPAACRASVAKFEQQRAAWSTKLGIPLVTQPSARAQARNN
jgi:hypothetical protein